MSAARVEGVDWSGNPPAERVQQYLDVIDEHNSGSRLQYADSVHSFNLVSLDRSDLRDLLRELHALQSIVERHEAGRDAAAAALAGWRDALEGDSGDAEIDAACELADLVADAYGIERD